MIFVTAVQPTQPPMRSHGEFRKEPCALQVGKTDHEVRGDIHAHRERQLELLIQRLPKRLQSAVRWLRRPSARWVRLPTGLLLIVGSIFSILHRPEVIATRGRL